MWTERAKLAEAAAAGLEPSDAKRLQAEHEKVLAEQVVELEAEITRRTAAERKAERLGKQLQGQRVSCAKSEVELMVQREVVFRQQEMSLPVEIVIADRGRLGIRFREHTAQVTMSGATDPSSVILG